MKMKSTKVALRVFAGLAAMTVAAIAGLALTFTPAIADTDGRKFKLCLTPKIKAFLDFVEPHIGTDRDPRLHSNSASLCFGQRQ